jgi:hypothetical protein
MADNNTKLYNVNALSKLMSNDDEYGFSGLSGKELRNALMIQEMMAPETRSTNPNVAPYGGERQFLPSFSAPLRRDPNVDVNFFSPPSQFDEQGQARMLGQTPMNMPRALMGQLRGSTQLGQGMARVGASSIAVQMPDGSVKFMPGMYDLGYGMPFLGGRLDVSGNASGQTMPRRNYGGSISFKKEFD